MVYSSRSLDAVILISVKPSLSKTFLHSLDKYCKSPESNLIPNGLYPFSLKFLKTFMALGRPLFNTL